MVNGLGYGYEQCKFCWGASKYAKAEADKPARNQQKPTIFGGFGLSWSYDTSWMLSFMWFIVSGEGTGYAGVPPAHLLNYISYFYFDQLFTAIEVVYGGDFA